MEQLPDPLRSLIEKYEREVVYFRKVSRMIDLFEWIVKWHATLALADILSHKSNISLISDKLKIMIGNGLVRPSLGVWMTLYQSLVKESIHYETNIDWFQDDELIAFKNKYNFIQFRNSYAHGGTPEENKCKSDLEKWSPLLQELLSLKLLNKVNLVINQNYNSANIGINKHEIQNELIEVYVTKSTRPLEPMFSLWPLVFLKEIQTFNISPQLLFYYYNALRKRKTEHLNYDRSLYIKSKQLWESFHQLIPVNEWREIGAEYSWIARYIRQLSQNYVERTHLKTCLTKEIVTQHKVTQIWGIPGSGKSSFIAHWFYQKPQEYDEPLHNNSIIYFIYKGLMSNSIVQYLSYVIKAFDIKFGFESLPVGSSPPALISNLKYRLDLINQEPNPDKLVLIIDGVDELGGEASIFLNCLPIKYNFISYVILSRHNHHVKQWLRRLRLLRYSIQEYTLEALSQNESCTLINQELPHLKYLETRSLVQEAIYTKSDGNPLLIKLICDGIQPECHQLTEETCNVIEIDLIYENLIKELCSDDSSGLVFDTIIIANLLKSAINDHLISWLLSVNKKHAKNIINHLLEVLRFCDNENNGYRLFHETFSNYIERAFAEEHNSWQIVITNKCIETFTTEIFDIEVRRYCHHFTLVHLIELKDYKSIWSFISNPRYVREIIKYNDYPLMSSLYQQAISEFAKTSVEDREYYLIRLLDLKLHYSTEFKLRGVTCVSSLLTLDHITTGSLKEYFDIISFHEEWWIWLSSILIIQKHGRQNSWVPRQLFDNLKNLRTHNSKSVDLSEFISDGILCEVLIYLWTSHLFDEALIVIENMTFYPSHLEILFRYDTMNNYKLTKLLDKIESMYSSCYVNDMFKVYQNSKGLSCKEPYCLWPSEWNNAFVVLQNKIRFWIANGLQLEKHIKILFPSIEQVVISRLIVQLFSDKDLLKIFTADQVFSCIRTIRINRVRAIVNATLLRFLREQSDGVFKNKLDAVLVYTYHSYQRSIIYSMLEGYLHYSILLPNIQSDHRVLQIRLITLFDILVNRYKNSMYECPNPLTSDIKITLESIQHDRTYVLVIYNLINNPHFLFLDHWIKSSVNLIQDKIIKESIWSSYLELSIYNSHPEYSMKLNSFNQLLQNCKNELTFKKGESRQLNEEKDIVDQSVVESITSLISKTDVETLLTLNKAQFSLFLSNIVSNFVKNGDYDKISCILSLPLDDQSKAHIFRRVSKRIGLNPEANRTLLDCLESHTLSTIFVSHFYNNYFIKHINSSYFFDLLSIDLQATHNLYNALVIALANYLHKKNQDDLIWLNDTVVP